MADKNEDLEWVLNKIQCNIEADSSWDRVKSWIEERERILDEKERRIKRQQHDFSTVIEIANQINAKSLNLERFESYITNMVMGQFGVLKAFIMKQTQLREPYLSGRDMRFNTENKVLFLQLNSPFSHWLCFNHKPLLLNDFKDEAERFPEIFMLIEAGVSLIFPLVKPGTGIDIGLKGILCLGEKISKRPYTSSEMDFLSFLGDMIAISLDNAQLYLSSITDSLTQVYTRGHFDLRLYQEITNHTSNFPVNSTPPDKEVRSVSLVILDIDNFKSFNDRYGHQIGDKVLQSMASLLAQSVRKMDIVARYGGEEFVIIFPDVEKKDAIKLADRLRKKIEDHKIVTEKHGELSVTASMGVAAFPEDASKVQELILAADQALYMAKESGRNQVMMASSREA